MKKYIISAILFITTLLLVSCGVSNPTGINNNSRPINTVTPSISAYQAQVHSNTLTFMAIEFLLRADNPEQLSAKQIKLLKQYRTEIEVGTKDEDNPLDRTLNHFWNPEYNTA